MTGMRTEEDGPPSPCI